MLWIKLRENPFIKLKISLLGMIKDKTLFKVGYFIEDN